MDDEYGTGNANPILPGERFIRRAGEPGHALPYRFFSPAAMSGMIYPLIVYLHSEGERGSDNESQLTALLNSTEFASGEMQAAYPCFILAPQCPSDKYWHDPAVLACIVDLINRLSADNPIDRDRIYITGVSIGGSGVWALISRYPSLFAAAIPVSGAGDPYAVRKARNVPIWAFHAADDPVITISGRQSKKALSDLYGTKSMICSLKSAGNRNLHFTEYPPGALQQAFGLSPHQAGNAAYRDGAALTWVFRQNRLEQYDINSVMPGVWHIDDALSSSFYIVEGADKALVIDTGMGGGSAYELVRSITRLPFSLAVTHAHGDHMMHADEFGRFYLPLKEKEIMPEFVKSMMPGRNINMENVITIKDGDTFDLGGGVIVEVFGVSGHTPGSAVFLDRFHGVIFTGDAIGSGSGVWMQVPGALPIGEYRNNLIRFLQFLRENSAENYLFLGGHRSQENGFPEKPSYNPLCVDLIRDMITLCGKLLNHEVESEEFPIKLNGETALTAAFGAASIVYREDSLN